MPLKTYYQEKSVPILKEELKIQNELALPVLKKVIVSIGLSEARFNKDETQERIKTLEKITGQKPLALKAKKAISNFKLRQGQVIAYMVTLRGKRMYDFIEKLFKAVLPRIRDFRGIPTYSFDGRGGISLGIKEQIVFPEIKIEEVQKPHSLGITIVTTAKDDHETESLIKAMGGIIYQGKKEKKTEDLETIEAMRENREKSAKDSASRLPKTAKESQDKIKGEEE